MHGEAEPLKDGWIGVCEEDKQKASGRGNDVCKVGKAQHALRVTELVFHSRSVVRDIWWGSWKGL